MATTTRIRKTKKKTEQKSEILNKLEFEDLRQLENLSKDVIISQKEMFIEEQSLRNMKLELQILESKIEKQIDFVQVKSLRYEAKKQKFAMFRNEINPKYGFKSGESMGYVPETGEIVR